MTAYIFPIVLKRFGKILMYLQILLIWVFLVNWIGLMQKENLQFYAELLYCHQNWGTC